MLKKIVITGALLLLGLLPVSMAFPQHAFAYNPLDTACSQSGSKGSTACAEKNSSGKIDGNDGIIVRATRVIATIAAIVAVIVIIIYGLQLVFSYGDTSKASTARNAILAAVIGLVVIGLAQAIVIFVVQKLKL